MCDNPELMKETVGKYDADDENSRIEMQLTKAFFDGYQYAIQTLIDGIPDKKIRQE